VARLTAPLTDQEVPDVLARDAEVAAAVAAEAAARSAALDALSTSVAGKVSKAANGSDFADVAEVRDNLGLGLVDNVAAIEMPVSVHQQDALDLKADLAALALLEDEVDALAVGGVNQIWVPAGDFNNVSSGALATSVTVGTRKAWSMSKSGYAWAGFSRVLPPDWTTFNIDLYWTRTGAEATGNARLRCEKQEVAVGGDIASTVVTSFSGAATFAVPAQNILALTRLAAAVAVSAAGVPLLVAPARFPASTEDTFTGAIQFLGILLTKAA
jgi:hypothetical protein